MKTNSGITVLMADDDPDDCLLTQDAWDDCKIENELRFVHDGEELLAYLRHKGKYCDPATAPRPGLILLDLNMPRMDGREALAEIKGDPNLRQIPVVVLTTSSVDEDILRAYDLGVSSFVTKPVTFDRLMKTIGDLGNYWLKLVELPPVV
ncbi:MAG: response regulator [Nannocystaceae bacterium]|nr:response regulator [Nannocystaceae bacterium]